MSGALPQLEISTFSNQLFWLVITFSILYFVISRSFLVRIEDIISQRQKYEGSLEDKIIHLNQKITDQQKGIADIYKNIKLQNDAIAKNINNTSSKINEKNREEIQKMIQIKMHEFINSSNNKLALVKDNSYNEYLKLSKIIFANFAPFIKIDEKYNANALRDNFDSRWAELLKL